MDGIEIIAVLFTNPINFQEETPIVQKNEFVTLKI